MTDKKQLPIAALDAMTANVNVGIDEVVSVFVAKWEDGLHKKKDALQKRIKEVKGDIDAMVARLKKSVDASEYVMKVPMLGIFSKIDNVEVNFEVERHSDSKKNTIVVSVGVYDEAEKRSYAMHTKLVVTKISADDVKVHTDLQNELAQLQTELVETMGEIKSVSRKERQVRGRISEMKLEKSGMSELMQNSEILQLIEVK